MNIKSWPTSLLLSVCLAGLVLVVTVMPFHAFVSTWGGTAIGPLLIWKSWKELLLVCLFVVFMVWLARDLDRFRRFFQDRFVALIGLYALLVIGSAAIFAGSNSPEAASAGVVMNLRYLLIAVIAYGVFRYGIFDRELWMRRVGKFLVIIGTTLAVIGILQVTVIPKEFLTNFGYDKMTTIAPFTLIDDNPDALRAFATLRGPNDFGAYLILPLVLAVSMARTRRSYFIPVGLMALGIFTSSSRSAWLGTMIAVATLIVLTYGAKILKSKKAALAIGSGIVATALLFFAALSVPAVRLAVFHSSPGDSSLTEGSTDAHWTATADGVERVAQDPLGCGPGCAGPASYYGEQPRISENYYVQIAEEVGITGLILWLTIAGIAARRLYRQRSDKLAIALLASGAGLSVIGFWLHVWSDDPLSLTWWALCGAALGIVATTQTGKKSKNLVS